MGVVATIEAQEHQRFLKSHLPFDALPYDPTVRYVYVGRDTRDVFMSAFNHYSAYTELTYSLLDAAGGAAGPMPRCPATERELWADWMTRSLFEWEADGWPFWSHHHHAASFWPYRDLPNVLMVHYADLLADLEAQMRRVAAFTQLEVAEDAWPELVAAARFDAMKQEAVRNEELHRADLRGWRRSVLLQGHQRTLAQRPHRRGPGPLRDSSRSARPGAALMARSRFSANA